MRILIALFFCSLLPPSKAVERHKFRTCMHTGFCKAHRQISDAQSQPETFVVDASTVQFQDAESHAIVTFQLRSSLNNDLLTGRLNFIPSAKDAFPSIRLHITQHFSDAEDPRQRWENSDVLDPSALLTLPLHISTESSLKLLERKHMLFQIENEEDVIAVLYLDPFAMHVFVKGQKRIEINGDQFFHFERRNFAHTDSQDVHTDVNEAAEPNGNEDVEEVAELNGNDGTEEIAQPNGNDDAEEIAEADAKKADVDDQVVKNVESMEGDSFDGFQDTSNFTASSLGVDVSFFSETRVRHLYGIPEHATHFALQDTVQERMPRTDPYRLYNLDVFQYELNEPMALYGSIPLLAATDGTDTIGVFWHNPSETFVDISSSDSERKRTSHWMSESGVMDLFLIFGPSPSDFSAQYTRLTGRAYLPPMFALGYHQCRWNYNDEADVQAVDAGFDTHLIPYDVLWLDIEHTDDKRYFTWDKTKFPEPKEMQSRLSRSGRKLVTIIDPHIKRDSNFVLHKEATEMGYYVKDESGDNFRGWCWSGDSSYIDFTNAEVRKWWSSLFRYDRYLGSTGDLYTWNDMNEPSVFNGPEVSMKKSAFSTNGIEHREWHNLYGFYMQMASFQGQFVRQMIHSQTIEPEMHRPFVLSRAFFAGSQRFGAVWNGDNMADWGHLQYATKMLLSMSIAGLTFVGADVGGFFGDPSPELLTRWYQAAIFYPFFRGHAHLDTARREPWVFGEPHTSRIRTAIQERYSFLPYIYTVFHTCAKQGLPVMRPIWYHFGHDEHALDEEDAFLMGQDLLIRPVDTEGAESVSVFLPSNVIWYNVHDRYKRILGQGRLHESIPSPIEFIPVFQRGGSVLVRKQRLRRSSSKMRHDPVLLIAALDANGYAEGALYLDDESTLKYSERQEYTLLQVKCTPNGVHSTIALGEYDSFVWVEQIEVYGLGALNRVPKRVFLEGKKESTVYAETNIEGDIVAKSISETLYFTYNADMDQLMIRKPAMMLTEEWSIRFE